MPILDLQRRHAELGRIRLGQKVATPNGYSRPEKLDRFRFTSPNRRHIDSLAQLYGGTPRDWDNNGKPEHEVITTATSVPVIVLRGSITQWMEYWGGGGCLHRCDGYHDVITDTDCENNQQMVTVTENRQKVQVRMHDAAKPTTRLSVMLSELDALGVWRLETHGWNAAVELPGMVEMAAMVADLVPADLVLHERRTVKEGQTSRFVVPGLDLHVAPRRMAAIAQAAADGTPVPAVVAAVPERTAIESTAQPAPAARQQRAVAAAPAPAPDGDQDWFAAIDACNTLAKLGTLGQKARAAGLNDPTVIGAFQRRNAELVGDTQPAAPDPTDDGPDEVPAAAEPDQDATAAWQALVAAAGAAGLDQLDAVDQLLADLYPDVAAGQHTAAQLRDAMGSLPTAQAGAA